MDLLDFLNQTDFSERGTGIEFDQFIHLGNSAHISPGLLDPPFIQEVLKRLVPGASSSDVSLEFVFMGFVLTPPKPICAAFYLPLSAAPKHPPSSFCMSIQGAEPLTQPEKDKYVQALVRKIIFYLADSKNLEPSFREKTRALMPDPPNLQE